MDPLSASERFEEPERRRSPSEARERVAFGPTTDVKSAKRSKRREERF
ncbi:hypothetical protein [Haloterrigena sp. H1]|nr:hypothetical protein [Haloterrigena sp. H1]